MSATAPEDSRYQPDAPIKLPPLYAWPPRPRAALRWLFSSLLFPWGFFFIGLSFVAWYLLTPPLAEMAELRPGWVALLWLRNAALLTLVAGGLHWLLYIRRRQGRRCKFDRRWPNTGSEMFLWRDQVRDNIFWSIASGVTIWTLYEAVTLRLYAGGALPVPALREFPLYCAVMMIGVFFWSTAHFYFNHRLLHWPPLYRAAHELHHRNVNIGPWTGISMHPLEHVIYFSLFALWWVVPVHPLVVTLTGLYQGVSPAVSHSGFDFVEARGRRLSAGDWFHQLHHQHFNVNYGNTPTPFDKVFGSWHDGSAESLRAQRERLRKLHAPG